jgi:hypothetical protein
MLLMLLPQALRLDSRTRHHRAADPSRRVHHQGSVLLHPNWLCHQD